MKGENMALMHHRGPYSLIHVKELDAESMACKWSRSDQLSWLGSFLLGERRQND